MTVEPTKISGKKPDVSPSEGQERKRAERSDKGKPKLTERDIKALTWTGEQYALRVDYLQEFLGRMRVERPKAFDPATGEYKTGAVSLSTANATIRKWEQLGLVKTQRIRGDRPSYVYLTATGYREVGLSYKDGAPGLARIKHIDSVNKVRLRLTEMKQFEGAVWV